MKKFLSVMVLTLVSAVAFASQCPTDMAKIDEALAGSPDLSEEQMAQVKELRKEGEQLHEEGKHQESVDTLGEAKAILGIE